MKTKKYIRAATFLMFATSVFLFAHQVKAADSPDVNTDGCVNAADYSLYKPLFAARDLQADLDNDGAVNIKDLAYMMKDWDSTCATGTSKLQQIWQGDISGVGDTKRTFIAQNFDVVIVKLDTTAYDANGNPNAAQGAAVIDLRNKINQAGRTVKILQYFKFAGTHTANTDPLQAPPYANDFIANGLTWTSPQGTPYVPTDTSTRWVYGDWQNPAKVNTYITLIKPYLKKQLQAYPIDGFFLDNASLLGQDETSHLEGGIYVSGYPTDYNAANLWNGKHTIVQALHADPELSDKTFFANNFWNKPYKVGGDADPNNSFLQNLNRLEFYDAVNGIMRERPFWNESNDKGQCRDKTNVTLDWFAQAPSDRGVVIYNYSSTTAGRKFSLAGALMVNKGNVYYLAGALGGNNFFPEYDIDLGAPLGNATTPQSNLYVRDFANGKVVMYTNFDENNSCLMTTSTTYDIGSGYEMLTGFSGDGTFTNIGSMIWLPAPTTITLNSANPAYVLRKL